MTIKRDNAIKHMSIELVVTASVMITHNRSALTTYQAQPLSVDTEELVDSSQEASNATVIPFYG